MKVKYKVAAAAGVLLLLALCFLNTRGEQTHFMDLFSLNWNGGYQEGDVYIIDETNEPGVICYTNALSLPAGTYTVRVYYEQQFVENTVRFYGGGQEGIFSLPLEQTMFEFPVVLEEATDDFTVELQYGDVGKFTISGIELAGEKLPYAAKDWQYISLLLIAACAAFYLFYRFTGLRTLCGEERLSILLTCGAVALSCLPLLMPGVPDGHDINAHVGRMEGLASALAGGQLPGRIGISANGGYGQMLVLYPDTFLYLPALLQLCGVSVVTAYKTLLALINAASALTAFIAVSSMLHAAGAHRRGRMWGGAVGAVAYCLFPYRLLCMYERAALGELLGMVFLPLLIAGVYHVAFGDKKKWYFLTIAATGIFHSHMISTLLGGVAAAALLAFTCAAWLKERRYLALLKAAGMTLLLNVSYLVPFVFYYTGGYTRVDEIKSETITRLDMNLRDVFIGGGDQLAGAFQAPIYGGAALCLIALALAGFFLYQANKDRLFDFMLLLAAGTVLTLLATTSFMPYEQLVKLPGVFYLLSSMQFPYRFASLCCSMLAVLAGCMAAGCGRLYGGRRLWLSAVMCALFLLSVPVLRTAGDGAFVWADSAGIIPNASRSFQEYWPAGTEGTNLYNHEVYCQTEDINVTDYRTGHAGVAFTYESGTQPGYADLPLFYYPGYEARLTDGTVLTPVRGENGRARLLLPPAPQPVRVRVYYKEPLLFRAASAVSLLGICGVIVYGFRKKIKFLHKKLLTNLH